MSKVGGEGMAEIMGRREWKKLQSKNTILVAAVKNFAEKGVRETSIADIMGEAELGIGTFYNYFESKESLLRCLLAKIIDDARREAEKRRQSKEPAPVILEAVLLMASGLFEENRFLLPLFLSAADRSIVPGKKSDETVNLVLGFRSLLSDVIVYGQERAEFRRDMAAEMATELIHSIFQSASFSALPFSLSENVRMKIHLLLSGIEPRSKTI